MSRTTGLSDALSCAESRRISGDYGPEIPYVLGTNTQLRDGKGVASKHTGSRLKCARIPK